MKDIDFLDDMVSQRILENFEEYSEKPDVLRGYLNSIIYRKKFKLSVVKNGLNFIETYFDRMKQDEILGDLLKKALFAIEDNLIPGDESYESEREKLARIINKNLDYIELEKKEQLR